MLKEIVPRMPRASRRRLLREGKKSRDPATATRFLLVVGLATGKTAQAMSDALGVARATVYRVSQAFRRGGRDALYDRRVGNGGTKVDDCFSAQLTALLEGSPPDFGWQRPTWTRELLCLEMTQQGYPQVSFSTLGRSLHDLGARLGMPKPTVSCPWPSAKRRRKLAKLRKLAAQTCAAEPVLYSDEVDIHLNPKLGRDWTLPGRQRYVLTPGENKKFYLAGALDIRSGKLVCTGAKAKNSYLFCQLLHKLKKQYSRARRIHLIVDNYCIHKSHATKKVLAELKGKIVLHFLPPYCPDHNRIERAWQDLHANVTRNHRCRTMNELLDNCRIFLDAYRWRKKLKHLRAARVENVSQSCSLI